MSVLKRAKAGVAGKCLTLAMASLIVCFVGMAQAETIRPKRVISINMCTDQLLLDLASREQIAGLSPFAGDVNLSWAARQAKGLPLLSGTAEEVMLLRPDLVVGWRFTKRETRAFIRAHDIAIEEFDTVSSIAAAREQIARFGEITGSVARAQARIAELDAALASLRAANSAARLRVLPISRRGWVSGQDSVISDLLMQAGLSNAASELGLRAGGFISLEAIVKLRPDAILISREQAEPEDQGSAMLLHPAIQDLFPPDRRIIIPERLTVCGGPMLSEAIQLLANRLSSLRPRDAVAP